MSMDAAIQITKRAKRILNVKTGIRSVVGKVDGVKRVVDTILHNQLTANRETILGYEKEKKETSRLKERCTHLEEERNSLSVELKSQRESLMQKEKDLSIVQEQNKVLNEGVDKLSSQLEPLKTIELAYSGLGERNKLLDEKVKDLTSEREYFISNLNTASQNLQKFATDLAAIEQKNNRYEEILSHYLPGFSIDKIYGVSSNSKRTGQISEKIIHKMCTDIGKQFGFDDAVMDVSNQKGSGDILIKFNNDLNILIEIKGAALSGKTKSPVEVDKFYRDISNKQQQFGLLIYHPHRKVPKSHIGDIITDHLCKSRQNTRAYFSEFNVEYFETSLLRFFIEVSYIRGHEYGKQETLMRTLALEKSVKTSYETETIACMKLRETVKVLDNCRKRKKMDHADIFDDVC